MQPGGAVTQRDPIIVGPTSGVMTQSGYIIKPPKHLTYLPAAELQYLGKMVELNQSELVTVYMLLQKMELALIGADIGGNIKYTKELKVLNYKKAMQCPDAGKWHKKRWRIFDRYNTLIPVP